MATHITQQMDSRTCMLALQGTFEEESEEENERRLERTGDGALEARAAKDAAQKAEKGASVQPRLSRGGRRPAEGLACADGGLQERKESEKHGEGEGRLSERGEVRDLERRGIEASCVVECLSDSRWGSEDRRDASQHGLDRHESRQREEAGEARDEEDLDRKEPDFGEETGGRRGEGDIEETQRSQDEEKETCGELGCYGRRDRESEGEKRGDAGGRTRWGKRFSDEDEEETRIKGERELLREQWLGEIEEGVRKEETRAKIARAAEDEESAASEQEKPGDSACRGGRETTFREREGDWQSARYLGGSGEMAEGEEDEETSVRKAIARIWGRGTANAAQMVQSFQRQDPHASRALVESSQEGEAIANGEEEEEKKEGEDEDEQEEESAEEEEESAEEEEEAAEEEEEAAEEEEEEAAEEEEEEEAEEEEEEEVEEEEEEEVEEEEEEEVEEEEDEEAEEEEEEEEEVEEEEGCFSTGDVKLARCLLSGKRGGVFGGVPERQIPRLSLEMRCSSEGESSRLSSRDERPNRSIEEDEGPTDEALCVLSSSSMAALLRVVQKLPFESLVSFCCEYLRQLNSHLRCVHDLFRRREKQFRSYVTRCRRRTQASPSSSPRGSPSFSSSPPASPSSASPSSASSSSSHTCSSLGSMASSPPLCSPSSGSPDGVSRGEQRATRRRRGVSAAPREVPDGPVSSFSAARRARRCFPLHAGGAFDRRTGEEGAAFARDDLTRVSWADACEDWATCRLSRLRAIQRCCQVCTEPVLQLLSCAYLVRLLTWSKDKRELAFPVEPSSLAALVNALSTHRLQLLQLHKIHFPSLDRAVAALARLYVQSVAVSQVLPVFRGLLHSEFAGSLSLVLHVRSPLPFLFERDKRLLRGYEARASVGAAHGGGICFRDRDTAPPERCAVSACTAGSPPFHRGKAESGETRKMSKSGQALSVCGTRGVSLCPEFPARVGSPPGGASGAWRFFFSRPSRLERTRELACMRAEQEAREAHRVLASFRRFSSEQRAFPSLKMDDLSDTSLPLPCSFSLSAWYPAVLSRLLTRLLHAGGVSPSSAFLPASSSAGPSSSSLLSASTSRVCLSPASSASLLSREAASVSVPARSVSGAGLSPSGGPPVGREPRREESGGDAFSREARAGVSAVAPATLQLCRAVLFAFHAALKKFMVEAEVARRVYPSALSLTAQQVEAGAFAHAHVAAEYARYLADLSHCLSEQAAGRQPSAGRDEEKTAEEARDAGDGENERAEAEEGGKADDDEEEEEGQREGGGETDEEAFFVSWTVLEDKESCVKAAQALAEGASSAAHAVRRLGATRVRSSSFLPGWSFSRGGGTLELARGNSAGDRHASSDGELVFFLGKAYRWRAQSREEGAAGDSDCPGTRSAAQRTAETESRGETKPGSARAAAEPRAIQVSCDEEDLLCAQVNALTQLVLFCAQVETPFAALATASQRRRESHVGRQRASELRRQREETQVKRQGEVRATRQRGIDLGRREREDFLFDSDSHSEKSLCVPRARGQTLNAEDEGKRLVHAGAWSDEETPQSSREPSPLRTQNDGTRERRRREQTRPEVKHASPSPSSLSKAEADEEEDEDVEESAESLIWREELRAGFAREAARFATLAQELKDRLVGLVTADAVHRIRSQPFIPSLPLSAVFAALLSPSREDGAPSLLSASLRLLPQCRVAVWEASMARVGEELVHAVLHTRLVPPQFSLGSLWPVTRAESPQSDLSEVLFASSAQTRRFSRTLARFVSTAWVLLLAYFSAPVAFDVSGSVASSAVSARAGTSRRSASALAFRRSVSFLRSLEAFLRAPPDAVAAHLSQMVRQQFPGLGFALLTRKEVRNNRENELLPAHVCVHHAPRTSTTRPSVAPDKRSSRHGSEASVEAPRAPPRARETVFSQGQTEGRGAWGCGDCGGDIEGGGRRRGLRKERAAWTWKSSLRPAQKRVAEEEQIAAEERAAGCVETLLRCGVNAEKFAANLLRLRPDLRQATREKALAEICEKLSRSRRQAAHAVAKARQARRDASGAPGWGPLAKETPLGEETSPWDQRAEQAKPDTEQERAVLARGNLGGQRRENNARVQLAVAGAPARGGGWGPGKKTFAETLKESGKTRKETKPKRATEVDRSRQVGMKARTAREDRQSKRDPQRAEDKKIQTSKCPSLTENESSGEGDRGLPHGVLKKGNAEMRLHSPHFLRNGDPPKSSFSFDVSASVGVHLSKETLPHGWPGKDVSSRTSPSLSLDSVSPCSLSLDSVSPHLASVSTAAALPSLLSTTSLSLASEISGRRVREGNSTFFGENVTAFSSAPSSCSFSPPSSSSASSSSSSLFSASSPVSTVPSMRPEKARSPALVLGSCGGGAGPVETQRGRDMPGEGGDLRGLPSENVSFREAREASAGAREDAKRGERRGERVEAGLHQEPPHMQSEGEREQCVPVALACLTPNTEKMVSEKSSCVGSSSLSLALLPLSDVSPSSPDVPVGQTTAEGAAVADFSSSLPFSCKTGETEQIFHFRRSSGDGSEEKEFGHLLNGCRQAAPGERRLSAFSTKGNWRSFTREEGGEEAREDGEEGEGERGEGKREEGRPWSASSTLPLLAAVARGRRELWGDKKSGLSVCCSDSVESRTASESEDRKRGAEAQRVREAACMRLRAERLEFFPKKKQPSQGKVGEDKRWVTCPQRRSDRRRPARRRGPVPPRKRTSQEINDKVSSSWGRAGRRDSDPPDTRSEQTVSGFVWQQGYLPPGTSRYFPELFTEFFCRGQREGRTSFEHALARFLTELPVETEERRSGDACVEAAGSSRESGESFTSFSQKAKTQELNFRQEAKQDRDCSTEKNERHGVTERKKTNLVRVWWRLEGQLLRIAASPAEIFSEAVLLVGDFCCVVEDGEREEARDGAKRCLGCGVFREQRGDGLGREGGGDGQRGVCGETRRERSREIRESRESREKTEDETEGKSEADVPDESKTMWHDLDYEWIDAEDALRDTPGYRLTLTFWDGVRAPLHIFFSSPRRRRLWARTLRAAIARASLRVIQQAPPGDDFCVSSRSSSFSSPSSSFSSPSSSFFSASPSLAFSDLPRRSSVSSASPSPPSSACLASGVSVRDRRKRNAGLFFERTDAPGRHTTSSSLFRSPLSPSSRSDPCVLVYSEHPNAPHSGTTVYFPSPFVFSPFSDSSRSSSARSASGCSPSSPESRVFPAEGKPTLWKGAPSLASGPDASRGGAVSEALSRFRELLGLSPLAPQDAKAVPCEAPEPPSASPQKTRFFSLFSQKARDKHRRQRVERTASRGDVEAGDPRPRRWGEGNEQREEQGGGCTENGRTQPTPGATETGRERGHRGRPQRSCKEIPLPARNEKNGGTLLVAVSHSEASRFSPVEIVGSASERDWCFPEDVCLSDRVAHAPGNILSSLSPPFSNFLGLFGGSF
ncbi:hypothetical protein TGARI_294740 [Toxoplasma gondii ARI]|uniref:Armadillo/beta-catenin-like repeat-containing protein n=1 Tax=Toxoplasma gondii ARI TaxID=1074872 RepID=A0A139XLN4_TOXGO|nr:hypothetical protein TGARI_294740 [Toxoplasma gondii ARI]